MSEYKAPIADQNFVINELAYLDEINRLPIFEHATDDLIEPILEEAAKFAREVLSPTNFIGDQQGCSAKDGVVTIPIELIDAYKLFVEGGWQGLDRHQDFGGMGMPAVVGNAASEMWATANMAWSLCPMLTNGGIETVEAHASDELKQRFLPKMVSGEWSATMDLTEPQAGSDLARVRTQALPVEDHYKIKGTKIYITWGEHEMSENIIHLVLARLPDAAEGVRGISLFLVPKYLVNDDGSLGERNDVYVQSVEHKLGIHASPTCVLNFGDNDGAIGYLVGQEGRGLNCMFTMMNLARLQVGVQGLAISERAYQDARDYAKERVQGNVIGTREPARIIQHPDVRRMLMTMKANIEAMRVAAYVTAAEIDLGHNSDDDERRQQGLERSALLTPIVKGWMTELALELASIGVQVHGGIGFVEETGVAQHLRDAKILTIYEGTSGIQANDLVSRKVLADTGRGMQRMLAEMQDLDSELQAAGDALASVRSALKTGRQRLADATEWLLGKADSDPAAVQLAAFNYMMLSGTVVGAWQMARAALVAQRKLAAGDGHTDFYEAKMITARFYAEEVLPRSAGYFEAATSDSSSAMELAEAQF